MNLAFHPVAGTTKNIAATTVSGNVNLIVGGGSTGPIQVRVYNAGPSVAFIKQGPDNTVAATTTADTPVLPGVVEKITLNVPAATNGGLWIAAITATGTATVYFTPGAGL